MIKGRTLSASERNGVITTRPYRWRGTPGWDPAADAEHRAAARLAASCDFCGAAGGQWCAQADGQPSEYLHAVRGRTS